MLNYTTSTLDSSHFSKWTPLTGMYIATATLVCPIAVTGDLVEGWRSKQYWIPSGYTSLNSVSLTILGAATKRSMDLSTTMPRHIDQLAKLGTSAFLCIALATIHPSLGKLENSELLSNTVSLSILVISSIASLCIQLRTGVIYTFKTAHIIILTMMSLLLLHCIISTAFLSSFKCNFQDTYEEQNQSIQKEWIYVEDNKHPLTEKLKQYLKRFSMLASSSCPHFQLSRSSHSTLVTIYGLVAAVAFFVTQITHGDEFLVSTSSSSGSAYDWSVFWILMSQTIALGVGTIVLCVRGCYIAMVYSKGKNTPIRSKPNMPPLRLNVFDFAFYLQHKSLFYKLKSLLSIFQGLYRLLLANTSAYLLLFAEVLCMCISTVCFMCVSDVCSWTTNKCITCKLPHSPNPTTRPKDLASEVEELSGQCISFIPLTESEGMAEWTMKSIIRVTKKHMLAKERNTEHIEELLRQHLSADFRGVVSFDSEEVAPLDVSQGSPPNCWSLPVVTLTNIAIKLPDVDHHSIVKLIKGVNEGLVLVKLIEDKFNNQPHFISVSDTAYADWTFGILCCGDIGRPLFQNKSPIEILESIVTSAKNDFHKVAGDLDTGSAVTALSKYRLCETLLIEYRNQNETTVQPSCERLFEKLRATIADILGACLINFKHYILVECAACTSIEKRREAAACILTLFGDTEKIMEIIETREIPEMSMKEMVFIDNWREYYKRQSPNPTTRPEDLALEAEEVNGQYISSIPFVESEGSAKWTMKSILRVTKKHMFAKERNTEHIEELLRQYLSADFRGVVSFDSEEAALLDVSQVSPPNCWSLPVVTLTKIAIKLPDVDHHSIVKFLKGVNEGLMLAKLIEDKLNNQPHFIHVTHTAYLDWTSTFLCCGDIRRPDFQNKSARETLEWIANTAKNLSTLTGEVADRSRYRLCETLLREYKNENEPTVQPSRERSFEKLRTTIVDILGACLINFKHYILVEYAACTSIEKKREAAASIPTWFGDTGKIMEIIETREIPEMSMKEMVFIDNWHKYYKRQRQSP